MWRLVLALITRLRWVFTKLSTLWGDFVAWTQPTRKEFKGTFLGGLMPGADIMERSNKTTLADAQNLILSKPVAYLDSVSEQRNCLTTPPPTYNGGDNRYSVGSNFTYLAPVFQKTIATFENTDWPSETWIFSGSGTASLVAAISEGDQCLSLANTAGQTATGTCDPLPTALNLFTPTYGILAVDTNWDNITNFSSGYIRIGSDSTNYRQYDLSAPAGTGNNILKFTLASPSSTTGTPTMSAIDYIQISVTASGGGSITVKFDNLRLSSFASVVNATLTLTPNALNVYNAFIYDKISSTDSYLTWVGGDSVFTNQVVISASSLVQSIVAKSGFTNTPPTTSTGTNFYFTQFPKTGTPTQNILYYVNGADGYFSYDQNASAGSQHARISSTAYKYICTHKNMVFLAAPTSNPNTVYPSDINDPTTITAGNAVTVQNVSGSYITGLYSMDDYLLITTNTGSFNLYGSDPNSTTGDFVLKRNASKVGCVEQKSGCRYGSQLYHFDGNGIYVFDGNDSTLISEGFESRLDGYNSKLCSMYYNRIRDIIIFNYVPDSVPDPVVTFTGYYQLTYSPTKKVWGHIGEINDASSVQFFGLSWGGSLYSKPLMFNGGLQFYRVDPITPTDITTQTWFAQTNWNDCDSPLDIKDFSDLAIYVRDKASVSTPTVNLYVYTDYDFSTVKQQFVNTAQVTTLTAITVASATLYRAIINGTNCDYTSDASATLAEIIAGLTSIINSTVGATVTAADVASTSITVTADVAGTSFDCGVSTNLIATETTANNNAVSPTNNLLEVGLKGVAGVAIAFKIQGTCDDQKDEAVMLSGYRGVYTFAGAP